ncbi:GNAT family N-acetyltransferase [Streptomyces sp. NPDC017086]|uniref:GNAT family N-acetyltransferase n=1 Tax=Streptomyces sp. NPDC017086 TaxID=3364976 RepID=UPI0037B95DA4
MFALFQFSTTWSPPWIPRRRPGLARCLFVAKIHGLAVTEHARGQGIAATLLKRTWQIHQQLGYMLLYGSYEGDRDLAAFYTRGQLHRPRPRPRRDHSPGPHRPPVPARCRR